MAQTEERRPSPAVYAAVPERREEAEALAAHLHVPLTETEVPSLTLRLDAGGLTLTDGTLSLQADFTHMLPRLKPQNLGGEMLVKAAKMKDIPCPTLIDATAGLGEDSLLLAAAGFHVQLYEYDPVIAALLRDALRRAAEVPELSEIVGRMELHEADSIAALPMLRDAPDVVLLDPMFPERQKSALIKKKFQLLQQLEAPCTDEEALLSAAIAAHPRKIVIKRPLKGAYLAGRKPGYSLTGKAIRYDCLVFPHGGSAE